MFKAVKGFKKEDLLWLAQEMGEKVSPTATIVILKDLILNNKSYKDDPEFIQEMLENVVADRRQREITEADSLRLEQEIEAKSKIENEKLRQEREIESEKLKQEREIESEKLRLESEKLRQEKEIQIESEKLRLAHELELAKLQSSGPNQGDAVYTNIENIAMRRKFSLPRLEFRKFSGEIKDWLPFWSQFEQIDKDEDIAPEDKFQYLIQATVSGSRAREVVESFPPSGVNYAKAVDSLKARFGREDILVEVYVRELLKLIISVQTKGKFSLTSLYDKLESYLRALETLGVTTDKCASILYPLVESCFPAEFLKAWNRTNISSEKIEAKERLINLMQFLRTEVEGEERISLAVAGFGLNKREDNKCVVKKNSNFEYKQKISTAAGLLTTSSVTEIKKNCIFCQGGKHASAECFVAQKLSLAEIQRIVKDKRCCFACLLPNHTAKKCRAVLRCLICSKKHVPIMCDQRPSPNKDVQETVEDKSKKDEVNMTNISQKSAKVFLQTLKVKLISENKEKIVRLLLDSASQKSYILKNVAEEMNFKPIRQEKIIHSLFGGITSKECQHNCYKIKVRDLNEEFTCNFEVRDQTKICGDIQPVNKGPWIQELRENGIKLTDVNQCCGSIEILIGADIMGKMLTGKRKVLSSGLVAIETYLGWTLMGKVPNEESVSENLAMTVTSLFINDADISNLWNLDTIGIRDCIEKKSKSEIDRQTKEHFLETVTVNKENRYEIRLPWSDDTPALPDNFSLAMKRLESTTAKLIAKNMYQQYENIFMDWMNEGIIEEVPPDEIKSYGNYLPHHPVIKESSSTTPIRPVFDASARLANHPSLNQSLQCGPNLIELIPDVLMRFRERKIGVTADIKKAFLQISICKEDRNFLRFLWWKDFKERKLTVFKHARVVFGVKCSPFLLSSVIEYHIRKTPDFDENFKERLLHSFYVDNVVTSVHSKDELEKFILDGKSLMAKGSFDLRQWEYTGDHKETLSEHETHVLGLIWNKDSDMLKVNLNWLKDFDTKRITKRSMLSAVHKIFDPFGFASPVIICPKLMLQKAWKLGIKWDEEVTGELRKEFLLWFQDLNFLCDMEIPRYMKITPENLDACTLHTFVDGSKDAYATVIFLRIEIDDKVELVFLAAKSRVAPLKNTTIPRMELLAATIGTRLTKTIIDALGWKEIKRYYWSDSTTVLAWISRDENWSVFVRNRVQEIRNLSNPSFWRHIPGDKNPADLPSRGCKAKQLTAMKWWEGPFWLKDPLEFEKYMVTPDHSCNEEEILNERLKSISMVASSEITEENNWYYRYFSNYEKIIRLVAWILRFRYNCKNSVEKRHGELTAAEFQEAELKTLRMVQKEIFSSEKDARLKTLQTWKDEQDIIRLKTKIIYRKDNEDFLKPIVLPSKHEVVKRLIFYVHLKHCHAGLQILLNLLREKYWILNGRKNVKQVLAQCAVCKRFDAKSLWRDSAPLPENRIKEADVFQITGVDMAGPLFLKDNKKSWILIFTCAIYRAVHLELVTAASTEAFLMGLRRYVSRRGRCAVIYSDNGRNFTGSANLLKNLDWQRIQKYSSVNAIDWKFSPPTAAWWGGFWERLIRIMKDLLKRVLGHAYLTYEEMITVLADVESVINSRPLTYLSEDATVKPISPSMFLQNIQEFNLPDVDVIEQRSLNRKLKYRQSLLKELRDRFRSEYLGALIQRANNKQEEKIIAVGDIVLIGSDNKKRLDWPLGRITELIPGRDKKIRLVKVQTSQHELLRPIQRIYPMEISSKDCPRPNIFSNSKENYNGKVTPDTTKDKEEVKFSRTGRPLKIPERLVL